MKTKLSVYDLLLLLKTEVGQRYEVNQDSHKGWFIRKQADQSLEGDWLALDEDGNYSFLSSKETKFYSSMEETNKAKNQFVKDTMSSYCQHV